MRAHKTLLILIVIILFGAIFAYVISPTQIDLEPQPETRDIVTSSPRENASRKVGADIPVSTEIPKKIGESVATPYILQRLSHTIPVLSRATVLEAMEEYAGANTAFVFSGQDFPSLGLFVDEINGLKNAGGFYWTLFINNTLSEKGASSAEVKPGDVVEWRYQKGI
ncbi:MAG: hypothetical protein UY39_C0043G0006 [Candidatus Kaiserbacteria bacterium GW2011_GWC2_49_12]|uniref:Transcobalamin-like C-terminal domain-containing protein n=3 Tax=Candidatus Kaiseribacteriota TaxID=1752734 RepID=A0A0G1ZEY5_9BACT|nr:MAG: hypothetical protein UY39_C0043G0006 [Candidatus Kaiserbacteria bacterium GW2011_GWC2_49_12]KKW17794.1 MAG: hypothetical protein UY57_C0010G0024 [Candidatus Kaiserbacteria bacterium GW2011_GWB1_50_17]OGG87973.1 MAG: hypothetical protein A3H15_00675 [Candidatus Kaiserbacteria bacterium RIFCSPLOWO2_12_FULL_50_28]HCM43599.1 hypothetical protein [Candidatus Kaiserbacteria bacterium]